MEQLLSEHRDVAHESLEYYQEMKHKCARHWKEIKDLPNTEENNQRLTEKEELSDNKKKDLQHMCINFIHQEQWHELILDNQ